MQLQEKKDKLYNGYEIWKLTWKFKKLIFLAILSDDKSL